MCSDVVNLRGGGLEAPEPSSIAEQSETLAQLQQQRADISTVAAEQIAEAQSIAPIVCVQKLLQIAHRVDDDLIDSLTAQGIAYVLHFCSAASRRCNQTPAGGRAGWSVE